MDDLVVIAVELLNEIKLYDSSVLNPINYMMISLLEYAVQQTKNPRSFLAWLLKLYDKLGMTSKVDDISKLLLEHAQSEDYERIGCLKYSHYAEFGQLTELELLCKQY